MSSQAVACLVTRLAPRPVTGALCVSLAGLGVEEDPAGLHTPGGRWPRASALAPWPRVHRRGIGLGQGRLDCAPGSRHPGAPRPLRRGQLRPGGLRREGTRGHQRGQAVRRWPRRPREPNRLANVWGSAAVATAWVQPEGETRVGLDPQLPHDLMHVRPMLPALPAGDGHDLCCRRLVAGVAPLDRHARRVEMETAGGQTEALGSGGRQAAVECGDPMGLEGIEGPASDLSSALLRGHAGRHEVGGGLMVQASGDAGARVIDTIPGPCAPGL